MFSSRVRVFTGLVLGVWLTFGSTPLGAWAADGDVDIEFSANLGTGFNDEVFSVAVQADGKILTGGNFTTLNGTPSYGLVRLNSDGTIDKGFSANLGTGFKNGIYNGGVFSVVVQRDGKILVGGIFTYVNGIQSKNLARLNSDGTVDTAFSSKLGTFFNYSIGYLTVRADGKIFANWVWLNSDGTVDTIVNLGTGFNGPIECIAVQADGKILIGGNFYWFNGTSCPTDFVRLNSDGTLDTTLLVPFVGVDFVSSVTVQVDGKILASGYFPSLSFERFNSDGTGDGFCPNFCMDYERLDYSSVSSITVQGDGKILAAGYFPFLNGTPCRALLRLNVDGTVDKGFCVNFGYDEDDSSVSSITVQGDGKILVVGSFTLVNGIRSNYLVRLM